MKKAGDILGPALRRMKDPLAARSWLDANWTALVGGVMASHLRPSICHNGVLRVEADSREWRTQAETMHQEICSRINASWGAKLVHELRIENRRGHPLTYETDNEHTPFLRNRRAPKP